LRLLRDLLRKRECRSPSGLRKHTVDFRKQQFWFVSGFRTEKPEDTASIFISAASGLQLPNQD
jgi:hypothetical protein